MFVQGALNVLLVLFGIFGAVVTPFVVEERPGDPPPWFAAVFYGGLALWTALLTVGVFVGAAAAKEGRNFNRAFYGSVAGVVSAMTCCNVLSLGLSVTALALLLQSRAEFSEA